MNPLNGSKQQQLFTLLNPKRLYSNLKQMMIKKKSHHPIKIRNEADNCHDSKPRISRINCGFTIVLLRVSSRENPRAQNASTNSSGVRHIVCKLCPASSISQSSLQNQ